MQTGIVKGESADFTTLSFGGMSSFVIVQVFLSPIESWIVPSAAQSPPQVPAA